MPTATTGVAGAGQARLLIHDRPDSAGSSSRPIAKAVQWLSDRARHGVGAGAPAAACIVQIDDLLGHRFLHAAQTLPLTEVQLPAGTYHVTVRVGTWHRRYTVTLEPGATVNLHLRPAIEAP